jgi:DNA-binding response OmpR family regulator
MVTLLKSPSENAMAKPPKDHTPPRILLVDDDVYILELNTGVLIRSGYDVDTAADGADAWKALHEIHYDLLISDHKMPRVTGLELIKKLRSEEMTLPVILMSGTMPTEELKRQPWLQINATLRKPFTVAELLNAVNNILGALIQTPFADLMLYPEKLEAALETIKISQAEKPANVPIRDQINPSHRILVVDDDNDTRQLSIDVLVGSGYDVEGVKDGAAGWKALQTGNNYDLVVTDNKMPNMTGIEMIAKLRSARMAVPVIMATGDLPLHEFARKPWLKPDAMLQRPFSNGELLETVRNVLHTDDGNGGEKETLLPKCL